MAPAGPVSDAQIRTGIRRVRELGMEPVAGRNVRGRSGFLAGSDDARAEDLLRALEDPKIDGVWALRGGYGVMRIVDRLDPSALRLRPRAVIGFSDNTALHLVLQRAGLISFHGPHAGYGRFPPSAAVAFRRVLFDPRPAGLLCRTGRRGARIEGGGAEGRLVGGNLSLLAAACGTPWSLRARGRIVILEDVDEPAYRVDRMLAQLVLSGALDGAAGIAAGRFTSSFQPGGRPGAASGPRRRGAGGHAIRGVLSDWLGRLNVPVLAELPFGHIAANRILPLGARCRLDADSGTLEALEAAVT